MAQIAAKIALHARGEGFIQRAGIIHTAMIMLTIEEEGAEVAAVRGSFHARPGRPMHSVYVAGPADRGGGQLEGVS